MDFIGTVLQDFLQKYGRMLIAGLVVFFVTLSGYQYYLHRVDLEKQDVFLAYKDLAKMVAKKVSVQASGEDCFSTVEQKFELIYPLASKYYSQYSKYGISLYFLMVCARIDYKLRGINAAIETLNKGLGKASDSSVDELIKVNIAVLKLFSGDAALENEGFSELEKLGDYGSLVSDYSYYKLGQYCWNKKRNNDAKGYWNTLVAGHKKSPQASRLGESVWARKAKERLEAIS